MLQKLSSLTAFLFAVYRESMNYIIPETGFQQCDSEIFYPRKYLRIRYKNLLPLLQNDLIYYENEYCELTQHVSTIISG